MAVARTDNQITWSASSSVSVSASGNQTSDAVSISATAIGGMIHLKSDNSGTPASGSTVDFYILYCGGDPDGAGADEYDTVGHGTYLATLDTNTEDPAITSVPISVSAETGFKIYAVNNDASNAITVSASYSEVTG